MNPTQRDALITLMLTPGLGHTLIGRCIEAFGSAADTLDASGSTLARIKGISRDGANRMRRDFDDIRNSGRLETELATTERHGATLLPFDEPGYPRLLKLIPDPPRLLWVRGELREDDALAVAIVGSRKCSHYGREQAERFGYAAADAGLCVVSGGAYGVDAAAHEGALRAGGRTIAVLGSGLANPYPKDHVKLFGRIARGEKDDAPQGAVVSEFPMTTPPMAENFPRRNRIVSGLALGTLVIEAARRSGALITARVCVEEQGRECMALPGRVDAKTSDGCHQMIREGWATLVTNIADALDALGEAGQVLKANVNAAPDETSSDPPQTVLNQGLTDSQKRIVEVVNEARSLDQIVALLGIAAGQVQADLTVLEIRGALKRRGGLFVRAGS